MYRVGLEGILGLTKRGDTLFIEPRAPAAWRKYTIEYRHGGSLDVIVVHNGGGVRGPATLTIDGRPPDVPGIPLVDDGERHVVEVRHEVEAQTTTAGSP